MGASPQPELPVNNPVRRGFSSMDRLLDAASTGPRYLCIPEIANMVVEAIRHRDRPLRHYELHAFVVMPNHVNLLMTPSMASPASRSGGTKVTIDWFAAIPNSTGSPLHRDELGQVRAGGNA